MITSTKSNLLLFFLVFVSFPSFANFDDGEKLVDGCNEVVNIYNKNQEKKLLAGITTSKSESLRAGFCIGVLSAYKQYGAIKTVRRSYECGRDTYYGYRSKTCYRNVTINQCEGKSWFELATVVAGKWSVKPKKRTMESLLQGVCDD